jgi:cation transport regulator ChaC
VTEMAAQIAASIGPSGSNPEYVFKLAEAMRAMGVMDEHLFELERAVRILVEEQVWKVDG